MNRRAFGEQLLVFMLANILISCGRDSSSPTAPSTPPPPAPPTPPLSIEESPFGIRFKVDGTEATRIGPTRESGINGSFQKAMEDLRIPTETNAGLVTMYDSVKPGSKYGIVFLVKKVRIVTSVSNVTVEPRDTWAGYEWKGKIPSATEGYVLM